MSDRSAISSLRRNVAFARQVPPEKILRRFGLAAQRRYDSAFKTAAPLSSVAPPLASTLPQPLFPRRSGMLQTAAKEKTFTFLNQSRRFPAAVDWFADREDPSSQLWLMNLHYMEYLEEASDELFEELVRDWILHNLPFEDQYWRDAWNSYTLSIRCVVWMQQLASRQGALSDGFISLAAASLDEQLGFLEERLERDIGGNHLIKNIKALLWGSYFFVDSSSERRRRIALAELNRQIPEQILPDGMHFERSPSYHNQVFADLLECRSLLPHPFETLDDALERMAAVTAELVHPDGDIPLFNDSGLQMSYPPQELLNAYRSIFGEAPRPSTNFAFSDAGYFGYRGRASTTFIDCGPVGPAELPAHSHSDILSFEWSVNGQRVIVDQGVFEYVPGNRREISRSTRSHNTVYIEGAEQCEFFGAFRCAKRATGIVEAYEPSENGIKLTGRHSGFATLKNSPAHRRCFEVAESAITIEDFLEPSGSYQAFASLLLAPEWNVELHSNSALLERDSLRILVRADSAIRQEEAEWWPNMGESRQTTRLLIPLESSCNRISLSVDAD